jgi:hypothetical protein
MLLLLWGPAGDLIAAAGRRGRADKPAAAE